MKNPRIVGFEVMVAKDDSVAGITFRTRAADSYTPDITFTSLEEIEAFRQNIMKWQERVEAAVKDCRPSAAAEFPSEHRDVAAEPLAPVQPCSTSTGSGCEEVARPAEDTGPF
jgi:hypothetical protein